MKKAQWTALGFTNRTNFSKLYKESNKNNLHSHSVFTSKESTNGFENSNIKTDYLKDNLDNEKVLIIEKMDPSIESNDSMIEIVNPEKNSMFNQTTKMTTFLRENNKLLARNSSKASTLDANTVSDCTFSTAEITKTTHERTNKVLSLISDEPIVIQENNEMQFFENFTPKSTFSLSQKGQVKRSRHRKAETIDYGKYSSK